LLLSHFSSSIVVTANKVTTSSLLSSFIFSFFCFKQKWAMITSLLLSHFFLSLLLM
jgi:hypothetical protein